MDARMRIMLDEFNRRLSTRDIEDSVRNSFIFDNPPLPPSSKSEKRIYANITKVINFYDPIMLTTEDIRVEDYILEDPDNIVIVYGDNNYFFTTRELHRPKRKMRQKHIKK